MANINHHRCNRKNCTGYDDKECGFWKRLCNHCNKHFCEEHWKLHNSENQTKLDVLQ